MNIGDVIIEFEDEYANETPVFGWSGACDLLEYMAWNPDKKDKMALAKGDEFGVRYVLDKAGFGLKIYIYRIAGVQEEKVFPRGFSVKDEALVQTLSINLKTVFGKDWQDYLSHIADMRTKRGAQAIFEAEEFRGQKHTVLAEKLGKKLTELGFSHHSDRIFSVTRAFISMLVDYHYQYGQVTARNKIGMEPPKSEPS